MNTNQTIKGYMLKSIINLFSAGIVALILFVSCGQNESQETSVQRDWQTVQDSTDRLHIVNGFTGPEAVRYDPSQDVYFVSNFNGEGGARDANGYISRLTPDGTIDSLQFMTGTESHPMHAPRGMYITDDTLWAADVDGIHGFDRTTGEHLRFIDFTDQEPGFLNDIVQGSDNNLYITDTGTSRVYKVNGNEVTVAWESLPHAPNGITQDPSSGELVLAPWGGDQTFYSWSPSGDTLSKFASASSGGNFDGIEFLNGRLIAASQVDSSLHAIQDERDFLLIHTPGRPADIGLDTQRNQVAVPYIALNRVDIWQLPKE